MIEQITKLLTALRNVRPYSLTLVFMIIGMVIFKDQMIHTLNRSILNKDFISTEVHNNVLISSSLKTLMHESKADRAYIFLFHNGVQYYNGTHKQKFSCDYEVVNSGISKVGPKLQDVPVSLFPEFIKEVIDRDMYYPNVDHMTDIVTKSELKTQGIKGIAVAPYYRNGKLIAMIGVDYVSKIGNTREYNKNPKEIKNKFQDKVNAIGNLLQH